MVEITQKSLEMQLIEKSEFGSKKPLENSNHHSDSANKNLDEMQSPENNPNETEDGKSQCKPKNSESLLVELEKIKNRFKVEVSPEEITLDFDSNFLIFSLNHQKILAIDNLGKQL